MTQGEYLALMGSNPSYFTTEDYYGNPIPPDLNRPVEQVSWNDATNYCAHVDTAGAGGGAAAVGLGVSAADGVGVGVCVPGGDDDGVQLWECDSWGDGELL